MIYYISLNDLNQHQIVNIPCDIQFVVLENPISWLVDCAADR